MSSIDVDSISCDSFSGRPEEQSVILSGEIYTHHRVTGTTKTNSPMTYIVEGSGRGRLIDPETNWWTWLNNDSSAVQFNRNETTGTWWGHRNA
jgi:hypothetical protein